MQSGITAETLCLTDKQTLVHYHTGAQIFQKSRCQMGGLKQVSYRGPQNIMCKCTKLNGPG